MSRDGVWVVRWRPDGRELLCLGTDNWLYAVAVQGRMQFGEAIDELLTQLYLQAQARRPERIVLDWDAADDPLHANQEGRFFHGYYGHYCYLPLYIFAGQHLLCARLRRANSAAAAGVVEELERNVTVLRRAWPEVQIIVRADSGFCREQLM